MKKRKYFEPTKEVYQLFSLEWRRAKAILKPFLDRKQIPKLYMATGLDGSVGWHLGHQGAWMLRMKGMKRYVKNSNIIALKEGRTLDEMKHTIRHEIVHCIHQNHKPIFKNCLRGLERARVIEEELGITAEIEKAVSAASSVSL